MRAAKTALSRIGASRGQRPRDVTPAARCPSMTRCGPRAGRGGAGSRRSDTAAAATRRRSCPTPADPDHHRSGGCHVLEPHTMSLDDVVRPSSIGQARNRSRIRWSRRSDTSVITPSTWNADRPRSQARPTSGSHRLTVLSVRLGHIDRVSYHLVDWRRRQRSSAGHFTVAVWRRARPLVSAGLRPGYSVELFGNVPWSR
jgi:hypothetical protein